MSRAQKGDRVAIVETNPTNPNLRCVNTGTVTKTGASGAEIRFDDERRLGKRPGWACDSQIRFIVTEGQNGQEPVLDRRRPVRPKETFASHVAKQQILPPVPMPEPTMSKTDPLEALKASGVDLLDLWEALGKKITPQAKEIYDKALVALQVATKEKTAAEANVNKILGDLRLAEQMLVDAKKALAEADAAVNAAGIRLDRAGGER